ncbi:hypothetical protein L6R53_10235 [Myxococcota bacterium]|nr:hypothetical protein [Myxococcota bacterium]
MSRRAWALLLLAGAALPGPAAAAEGLPAFDASSPLLAADGEQAALVPGTAARPGFVARVDVQHAHAPMVYDDGEGGRIPLIAAATQVDLSASWGWRHLRLEGTAPMVVRATGETLDGAPAASRAGLADPALRARFAALPGGAGRVGLAAQAGARLPMQGATHGMGQPGPTGLAGVVVDAAPGRLWAGLQAEVAVAPRAEDRGLSLDDRLDLRAAASLRVAGAPELGTRVGVELRADTALAAPWAQGPASPTELLLTGLHARPGGLRLRLGLGAGVVPAVGAPAWRLLVGVGHRQG